MFESRFTKARLGRKAMVAAAHPLAAQEGLRALERGGNAMDACLVMAGVTSVVLPNMCGLGGDAFMIYYDASSGKAYALNGSGAGGNHGKLERFEGQGPILPQHGIVSVGVPGAPLVFEQAQKRFGTFSLRECFEPGAAIAEEGFVVSRIFSRAVASERNKLEKYERARRTFLESGNPPSPGTLFRQPKLARTLRQFGSEGAEFVYKGSFARHFYEINDLSGGLFDGTEFENHLKESPGWYQPLATDYRGYTLLQTAPVSPGFVMLQGMNLLEMFDPDQLKPLSQSAVHLMVEAKKVAFADRNAYAGDPSVTGFDASSFVSKDHAKKRFSLIDPDAASCRQELVFGGPDGDTTSFVAWDEAGNCCSFIHSIAFAFGSGIMVPETGVLLNNRVGRSFNLVPGHRNCLEPGKRPMHTLNCYMVLKDGEPFIVGGTPGGDGQPQWNMQMLSLMLDFGAGPQEAADFPRHTSLPGTDMIGVGRPFRLIAESRFPQETLKGLAAMGHEVRTVGAFGAGGGAQIIMRDAATGVLLGGSDSRVEGIALGV